MNNKKPISIDEYRMRPIIDAQISRFLDNMDDNDVDNLINNDKFTEMLEKAYYNHKDLNIDCIDPFFK